MKKSNEKERLTNFNSHLLCGLCGGYCIDATTIVECLHSFCKSCIVHYFESSKFCPKCDVQVHKTDPLLSIRPDIILQKLIYKIVPGLHQNEMFRRKKYYAETITQTPLSVEDAGCDINRKFILPEDYVSLALIPVASKESQKSLVQPRYIRCKAAVTMGQLQSLLRGKFNLPNKHPLHIYSDPDIKLKECTKIVDVAYLKSWQRNQLVKLFYRIYFSKRIKFEEEIDKKTFVIKIKRESGVKVKKEIKEEKRPLPRLAPAPAKKTEPNKITPINNSVDIKILNDPSLNTVNTIYPFVSNSNEIITLNTFGITQDNLLNNLGYSVIPLTTGLPTVLQGIGDSFSGTVLPIGLPLNTNIISNPVTNHNQIDLTSLNNANLTKNFLTIGDPVQTASVPVSQHANIVIPTPSMAMTMPVKIKEEKVVEPVRKMKKPTQTSKICLESVQSSKTGLEPVKSSKTGLEPVRSSKKGLEPVKSSKIGLEPVKSSNTGFESVQSSKIQTSVVNAINSVPISSVLDVKTPHVKCEVKEDFSEKKAKQVEKEVQLTISETGIISVADGTPLKFKGILIEKETCDLLSQMESNNLLHDCANIQISNKSEAKKDLSQIIKDLNIGPEDTEIIDELPLHISEHPMQTPTKSKDINDNEAITRSASRSGTKRKLDVLEETPPSKMKQSPQTSEKSYRSLENFSPKPVSDNKKKSYTRKSAKRPFKSLKVSPPAWNPVFPKEKILSDSHKDRSNNKFFKARSSSYQSSVEVSTAETSLTKSPDVCEINKSDSSKTKSKKGNTKRLLNNKPFNKSEKKESIVKDKNTKDITVNNNVTEECCSIAATVVCANKKLAIKNTAEEDSFKTDKICKNIIEDSIYVKDVIDTSTNNLLPSLSPKEKLYNLLKSNPSKNDLPGAIETKPISSISKDKSVLKNDNKCSRGVSPIASTSRATSSLESLLKSHLTKDVRNSYIPKESLKATSSKDLPKINAEAHKSHNSILDIHATHKLDLPKTSELSKTSTLEPHKSISTSTESHKSNSNIDLNLLSVLSSLLPQNSDVLTQANMLAASSENVLGKLFPHLGASLYSNPIYSHFLQNFINYQRMLALSNGYLGLSNSDCSAWANSQNTYNYLKNYLSPEAPIYKSVNNVININVGGDLSNDRYKEQKSHETVSPKGNYREIKNESSFSPKNRSKESKCSISSISPNKSTTSYDLTDKLSSLQQCPKAKDSVLSRNNSKASTSLSTKEFFSNTSQFLDPKVSLESYFKTLQASSLRNSFNSSGDERIINRKSPTRHSFRGNKKSSKIESLNMKTSIDGKRIEDVIKNVVKNQAEKMNISIKSKQTHTVKNANKLQLSNNSPPTELITNKEKKTLENQSLSNDSRKSTNSSNKTVKDLIIAKNSAQSDNKVSTDVQIYEHYAKNNNLESKHSNHLKNAITDKRIGIDPQVISTPISKLNINQTKENIVIKNLNTQEKCKESSESKKSSSDLRKETDEIKLKQDKNDHKTPSDHISSENSVDKLFSKNTKHEERNSIDKNEKATDNIGRNNHPVVESQINKDRHYVIGEEKKKDIRTKHPEELSLQDSPKNSLKAATCITQNSASGFSFKVPTSKNSTSPPRNTSGFKASTSNSSTSPPRNTSGFSVKSSTLSATSRQHTIKELTTKVSIHAEGLSNNSDSTQSLQDAFPKNASGLSFKTSTFDSATSRQNNVIKLSTNVSKHAEGLSNNSDPTQLLEDSLSRNESDFSSSNSSTNLQHTLKELSTNGTKHAEDLSNNSDPTLSNNSNLTQSLHNSSPRNSRNFPFIASTPKTTTAKDKNVKSQQKTLKELSTKANKNNENITETSISDISVTESLNQSTQSSTPEKSPGRLMIIDDWNTKTTPEKDPEDKDSLNKTNHSTFTTRKKLETSNIHSNNNVVKSSSVTTSTNKDELDSISKSASTTVENNEDVVNIPTSKLCMITDNSNEINKKSTSDVSHLSSKFSEKNLCSTIENKSLLSETSSHKKIHSSIQQNTISENNNQIILGNDQSSENNAINEQVLLKNNEEKLYTPLKVSPIPKYSSDTAEKTLHTPEHISVNEASDINKHNNNLTEVQNFVSSSIVKAKRNVFDTVPCSQSSDDKILNTPSKNKALEPDMLQNSDPKLLQAVTSTSTRATTFESKVQNALNVDVGKETTGLSHSLCNDSALSTPPIMCKDTEKSSPITKSNTLSNYSSTLSTPPIPALAPSNNPSIPATSLNCLNLLNRSLDTESSFTLTNEKSKNSFELTNALSVIETGNFSQSSNDKEMENFTDAYIKQGNEGTDFMNKLPEPPLSKSNDIGFLLDKVAIEQGLNDLCQTMNLESYDTSSKISEKTNMMSLTPLTNSVSDGSNLTQLTNSVSDVLNVSQIPNNPVVGKSANKTSPANAPSESPIQQLMGNFSGNGFPFIDKPPATTCEKFLASKTATTVSYSMSAPSNSCSLLTTSSLRTQCTNSSTHSLPQRVTGPQDVSNTITSTTVSYSVAEPSTTTVKSNQSIPISAAHIEVSRSSQTTHPTKAQNSASSEDIVSQLQTVTSQAYFNNIQQTQKQSNFHENLWGNFVPGMNTPYQNFQKSSYPCGEQPQCNQQYGYRDTGKNASSRGQFPYNNNFEQKSVECGESSTPKKNTQQDSYANVNQRYNYPLIPFSTAAYNANYSNIFPSNSTTQGSNFSSLMSSSGYNFNIPNPKMLAGQQSYLPFNQSSSNYIAPGTYSMHSANTYQNSVNQYAFCNSNPNTNFSNNLGGSFSNFAFPYYNYNSYSSIYPSENMGLISPHSSPLFPVPSRTALPTRNTTPQPLNDFSIQSGFLPVMPFVSGLQSANPGPSTSQSVSSKSPAKSGSKAKTSKAKKSTKNSKSDQADKSTQQVNKDASNLMSFACSSTYNIPKPPDKQAFAHPQNKSHVDPSQPFIQNHFDPKAKPNINPFAYNNVHYNIPNSSACNYNG